MPGIVGALVGAPPVVQRELLSLLGRLTTVLPEFPIEEYLRNADPLVRREAVKLMVRMPAARDGAILSAVSDEDDRVVFVGLTAAQESCPPDALPILRERVDHDELDSKLRTMCIRIVAQNQPTTETLQWLLGMVVTKARWPRRPKLRPSTPEMLAALSSIASRWREHPGAATGIKLAEHSKDEAIRAKVRMSNAGPRKSEA